MHPVSFTGPSGVDSGGARLDGRASGIGRTPASLYGTAEIVLHSECACRPRTALQRFGPASSRDETGPARWSIQPRTGITARRNWLYADADGGRCTERLMVVDLRHSGSRYGLPSATWVSLMAYCLPGAAHPGYGAGPELRLPLSEAPRPQHRDLAGFRGGLPGSLRVAPVLALRRLQYAERLPDDPVLGPHTGEGNVRAGRQGLVPVIDALHDPGDVGLH